MISSSCLDAIDRGLSRLMSQVSRPHHHLPFGGVSILLFGDLAQVPAVVPNADDYNQYLHQFLRTCHYQLFLLFELRQQMRQAADEAELLQILDACRGAQQRSLPPDIQDLLRQRFFPDTEGADRYESVSDFLGDTDSLCITFTNRAAANYNLYKITQQARGGAEISRLSAFFYVRGVSAYSGDPAQTPSPVRLCSRCPANDRQIAIYRRAIQLRKTSCIVPFAFDIAVGSKVMLLKNLSFADKLINGARGVVTALDSEDGHIHTIWVLFNGHEQPSAITRRICHSYKLDSGDTVELYQFPLNLAWAATAHKAQGQTLEKVAIDISEDAFAHG